ncbi:recombinase, partial [Pseudomonas aeruginosa]
VLQQCACHHLTGSGGGGFTGIAVLPYKARLDAGYGAQADLLSNCASILADEVHDIPAGFPAWLDGSELDS